jgi:hypothetical protein
MRSGRLAILAPLGVLLALLLGSPASAKELPVWGIAHASGGGAGGGDDEVVLPSRVANAVKRAENLLDAAGTSVDTGDTAKAVASLKAVQTAVLRADKVARRQMKAKPDPNAEEGATPGPDSVIAVLTLDQETITTVAGLFDTSSGQIVDAASRALSATLNTRDKLLAAVAALPSEGAGADYADGMADTVGGYDDEVANIAEALSDDTLSAGGKSVLRAALAQSRKARAKVNSAFGGGE